MDVRHQNETPQWETFLPFSYFHLLTIRPVPILVLQQIVSNDTTLMEVENKPQ